MKRTPIVVPGQVYLHSSSFNTSEAALIRINQTSAFKREITVKALNEYLVVTDARQGEITYNGVGFSGYNEVDSFLERFGPVDPADLTPEETAQLKALLPRNIPLTVGWVEQEDDETE